MPASTTVTERFDCPKLEDGKKAVLEYLEVTLRLPSGKQIDRRLRSCTMSDECGLTQPSEDTRGTRSVENDPECVWVQEFSTLSAK